MCDFYTPYFIVDRTREKIYKKTENPDNPINQRDIVVVQQSREQFFSSVHETLARIEHMLGHKMGLSKFRSFKILPDMYSDKEGQRVSDSRVGGLELGYQDTTRRLGRSRLTSGLKPTV